MSVTIDSGEFKLLRNINTRNDKAVREVVDSWIDKLDQARRGLEALPLIIEDLQTPELICELMDPFNSVPERARVADIDFNKFLEIYSTITKGDVLFDEIPEMEEIELKVLLDTEEHLIRQSIELDRRNAMMRKLLQESNNA